MGQEAVEAIEEKAACNEAHRRDIAALEAMLQHASADRDRLAAENEILIAKFRKLSLDPDEGFTPVDKEEAKWRDACATTPRSSSASECARSRISLEEPELERSGEFDVNVYKISSPMRSPLS